MGDPLCHARTGPPGVDSLTIRQSMRLKRRGSRKFIVMPSVNDAAP
jgi:hypothetical protein